MTENEQNKVAGNLNVKLYVIYLLQRLTASILRQVL